MIVAQVVRKLMSLFDGSAVPALANPRMGVSVHVAGLQSAMALWALGLMWQHLALPAGAERAAQVLAVLGLYAIFTSLLFAALWGTSRHAHRRRRSSGQPRA